MDNKNAEKFAKDLLAKLQKMDQPVESTITRSATGEIIEVVQVHTPRQESSVEFTVDSKGYVKPTVKVYHEDPYIAKKLATEMLTDCVRFANELSAQ